jgi:hypothetical protein
MWRPDSGTSPNREFVLASEDVWREFWARWREIDPLVVLGAHPADIEYQRDELRAWARERVKQYGLSGRYIIPV